MYLTVHYTLLCAYFEHRASRGEELLSYDNLLALLTIASVFKKVYNSKETGESPLRARSLLYANLSEVGEPNLIQISKPLVSKWEKCLHF